MRDNSVESCDIMKGVMSYFGNRNGWVLSLISFSVEYKYPGSVLEADQQNVYQSPYPGNFDIKPHRKCRGI